MLDRPKGVDSITLNLDLHIDKDELYNNFLIMNNNDNNEEEIFDEYNEYNQEPNSDENCINCFYSNGTFCGCKKIYINSLSPLCWFYRDSFTMRTNSDFQDDNDNFDE